jgi:hypothetical protein
MLKRQADSTGCRLVSRRYWQANGQKLAVFQGGAHRFGDVLGVTGMKRASNGVQMAVDATRE